MVQTDSSGFPELITRFSSGSENLQKNPKNSNLFLFVFSEKANLAVTLVDESNIIVGHAAFYDAPNWNIARNQHWSSWIKTNFQAPHSDVST